MPRILLQVLAVVLVSSAMQVSGQVLKVEHVMFDDPVLELPKGKGFYPNTAISVWIEALGQSEIGLKRKVAQTIVRAHEVGMKGLEETIKPMIRELEKSDAHPSVQLSMAQALVALDTRDAASMLLAAVERNGLEMSQTVEPAMARWQYQKAEPLWKQRLQDSGVSKTRLVLALRGLASLKSKGESAKLLNLAADTNISPRVRFEAADAASRVDPDGTLSVAEQLNSSDALLIDRIVAARLIARSKGSAAEAMLLKLAVDKASTVAAIALKRLLEIDPVLISGVAGSALGSKDANVRMLAARAIAVQSNDESISKLQPLLDDRHPANRGFVCDEFYRMAVKDDLRDNVIAAASKMLHGEGWRGFEQSILLLTSLKYTDESTRFVELLNHERPEVFVTAAWALRVLAIESTLPAMLSYAESIAQPVRNAEFPKYANQYDHQLAHLYEAFGQQKFMPSQKVMISYIPKTLTCVRSRRGGIWAIGLLLAENSAKSICDQLIQRAADASTFNPEDPLVRRMAAISLARMNAKDYVASLRKISKAEGQGGQVGYACAWAVSQLTGEDLPKLEARVFARSPWFLLPLEAD